MADNPKILIYGVCLSAVYGVSQQQGWPTLLQNKLNDKNHRYQVVNASISGETTSGGLSRLSATLTKFKPNIVVLALGANDGLRGLPIPEMTNNLNSMISLSEKSNAKVLLLGMKIPPNYGAKYSTKFSQTFSDLSQQHKINFVPFMLKNVATIPNLNQDDGIHPNAQAQPLILDNIWPELHDILEQN
jgi:acyl-CoA thioesterase-1